jgi:hypothetical protein
MKAFQAAVRRETQHLLRFDPEMSHEYAGELATEAVNLQYAGAAMERLKQERPDWHSLQPEDRRELIACEIDERIARGMDVH